MGGGKKGPTVGLFPKVFGLSYVFFKQGYKFHGFFMLSLLYPCLDSNIQDSISGLRFIETYRDLMELYGFLN